MSDIDRTLWITTSYWTFSSGGLLDSKPVDGLSHLIAHRDGTAAITNLTITITDNTYTAHWTPTSRGGTP